MIHVNMYEEKLAEVCFRFVELVDLSSDENLFRDRYTLIMGTDGNWYEEPGLMSLGRRAQNNEKR